MFKKLLLPLDLTDKHLAVIETAEKLALQNSGEVMLLHVIEAITGLSAEEEKHFYLQLEHAAGKHLQIYACRLAECKVPLPAKGIDWEPGAGNRSLRQGDRSRPHFTDSAAV